MKKSAWLFAALVLGAGTADADSRTQTFLLEGAACFPLFGPKADVGSDVPYLVVLALGEALNKATYVAIARPDGLSRRVTRFVPACVGRTGPEACQPGTPSLITVPESSQVGSVRFAVEEAYLGPKLDEIDMTVPAAPKTLMVLSQNPKFVLEFNSGCTTQKQNGNSYLILKPDHKYVIVGFQNDPVKLYSIEDEDWTRALLSGWRKRLTAGANESPEPKN